MKEIESLNNNLKSQELDRELLKDYINAMKDKDFVSIVTRTGVPENVAMKYTSKFEKCANDLKNCSKCKSIMECKNEVEGCVYYPNPEGNRVRFDYVACKYKKEQIEEEKHKSLIFEEPDAIKNARMADIDLTDKNRAHVIKWIKKFYTEYKKNKNIKGAYLHGSFGSGKSYIISALLNELAKMGEATTIIYYPEMLRNLKESFNDDFDIKMDKIKRCDCLLIDDIGAESVTPWSRDEILGTILQYRMDSHLPTFFTSNLTIDELEIHLSNTKNGVDIIKAKRIIERIKQLTEDLELISENRRK